MLDLFQTCATELEILQIEMKMYTHKLTAKVRKIKYDVNHEPENKRTLHFGTIFATLSLYYCKVRFSRVWQENLAMQFLMDFSTSLWLNTSLLVSLVLLTDYM